MYRMHASYVKKKDIAYDDKREEEVICYLVNRKCVCAF